MNVEGLEGEPVGHVRGRLAAFKVPKSVRPVAALPRNASGEIIERELRDRPWGAPHRRVFPPRVGAVTASDPGFLAPEQRSR